MMGKDRNAFTQLCSLVMMGIESVACPIDRVSRSLTLRAARLSLTVAGKSSGKNFTTRSAIVSLPSATANPTAVDVKHLLMELSR